MSIPTAQVEAIRDAAGDLVDACEELIGYREDPDADREDKAAAADEVDNAIVYLVSRLPKKMQGENA